MSELLVISVFLILSGILAVYLAYYILRFRETDGAIAFSGMMLSLSIYSIGYALELNSSTIEKAYFWIHLEYIGVALAPLMWLIFIYQYISQGRKASVLLILLFSVVPVVTFVTNFTNEWHHKFYTSVSMDYSGVFPVVMLQKGIFYWIHIYYFYFIVLLVNIMLIRYIVQNKEIYRRQAVILLLGSTIPWVVNVISITGHGPTGIDLNPFAILFIVLIIFLGQFRYRMFDFAPIAMENVFESINEGIILTDKKNKIISFNPAALAIFPELIKYIGKKPQMLIANLSPIDPNKLIENFFLLTNKNEYQLTISLNTDNNKDVLGYIYNLANITEERERERQLHDLNIVKDKFFSVVANFLQAPFGEISRLSHEITDQNKGSSIAEKEKNLNSIYDISFKYFNVLETLLTWTRIQTNKIKFEPRPVDLTVEINEIVKNYKYLIQSKELKLMPLLPSEFNVEADADMIRIVFSNLITNAIKYSYRGGHISIVLEKEKRNTIFYVKDQGIGFNQEVKSRLFDLEKVKSEPGTEGEPGTGLGLMVSKYFVEIHGGEIVVDDSCAHGSEIIIRMPLKLTEKNIRRNKSSN